MSLLLLEPDLDLTQLSFHMKTLNKKAKIIQTELEHKMLGRYFHISVGICADASTVAKQLYNKIKINKLSKEIDNWTKKYLNRTNQLFTNKR